jgi:hypothetical protein
LIDLAYDGTATGRPGNNPVNTFLLDGANIVIKENSFNTHIDPDN